MRFFFVRRLESISHKKSNILTEHPYIVAPQRSCRICLSKCIFVSNRSPQEHLNFNSGSKVSDRFSSLLSLLQPVLSLCSFRTCCLSLRFVNILPQNLHFCRIETVLFILIPSLILREKHRFKEKRKKRYFQNAHVIHKSFIHVDKSKKQSSICTDTEIIEHTPSYSSEG